MVKHKSPLHFKSAESYKKWLAYGHIHGSFKDVPGHQQIVIRGRKHKVKHSR